MTNFNIISKVSLISLSSVLFVSACGGGGSENDSPGNGSGSGATPPPPKIILADYQNEASLSSLSSLDSFLQLGFMAQNDLAFPKTLDTAGEVSCSNGGLFEKTHFDTDSNSKLSSGDTLNITYRECYIGSLADFVDGSVVYTINSYVENEGFDATLDLSDLEIDGSINLDGQVRIEYAETPTNSELSMITLGDVALSFNGEKVLTFYDFEVMKQNDYLTAKYRVNVNGTIDDETIGEAYQVAQIESFSGFFNEYPNEGVVSIFTSSADVVKVSANFVENSMYYDVAYGEESFLVRWEEAIEGALMGVGTQTPDFITPFRSDNFSFAAFIKEASLNNFGLSDSIVMVFSRPVDSASSSYGEASFENFDFPYDRVPADIEINGSMVIVTPKRALEANATYTLSNIEAISTNGQTAFARFSTIKTSNKIIPVVSKQSNLFRYNDTPQLSAIDTVNNTDGVLSFQWKEKSEVGVEFNSPTEAVTTFTVPEGTTEDITVEVVITAPSGYSVTETLSLTYMAPMSTFLSFDSPTGDYIGGGESRVYTEADGVFWISYDVGSPNFIGVSYDGTDWWNLDLAAPANESIDVGVYEEARRYPFQSPTLPGLSFTGSGRGCNQSIGKFEILEMSYDGSGNIQNLAVDFEQSCELTGPLLKGKFRFNSDAPLNK